MVYTSKIYLPILKTNIRIKPLKNKNYFEILKFIISKDDEGLHQYFEWLLNDLIIEKNVISNLTSLEKFLIMLDVRSLSLGDKISMNTSNNIKIDLLLSTIKNNILDKIKELELTKIFNFYNNKITFNLPKSFVINDIDKIYTEIIDNIQIDDNLLNFNSLTDEEKDIIINNIPANISVEMFNFIKNIQNTFNNITIISENEKIGIQKVPLNVFDNTMFYFIKTLYGEELYNFYETEFNMIYKMHFTHEHYMDLTPNECRIYINFYNEDIKKQEEAQSKQSSTSKVSKPSIPSIPKIK